MSDLPAFEIGDRVTHPDTGWSGTVTYLSDLVDPYTFEEQVVATVRFDEFDRSRPYVRVPGLFGGRVPLAELTLVSRPEFTE